MNILMISRSTLFTVSGGDTIQVIQTAKYLRMLGISVDIQTSEKQIDYSNYDLIHFFNIIRPADILSHIAASKLPFVVSTIYVDFSEFDKKKRGGLLGFTFKYLDLNTIEYLKCLARFIKNGEPIKSATYLFKGHRNSIKYIAKKSEHLLPNSESEYRRFKTDYKLEKEYTVVPYAVDTNTFDLDATPDLNYKDHVLCVARMEGRKNQLNLIKAIKKTDFKLSIIGNLSPNHMNYYEACKKEAQGSDNIQILSEVRQNELAPIYKASKVHVLASWHETAGLSTMEAALLGCNIVITDKGDTRDYFRDYAFYCEPDDVDSIQHSIEEAYKTPFSPELRKFILENYTWELAANKTLDAYNKALNTKR
ncbi:MAG TPA: glycosyltransferase family 4 protein [Flavitalea sp.]|nr:glycosyltransferase family 4 protein [Flavitalea sp.]